MRCGKSYQNKLLLGLGALLEILKDAKLENILQKYILNSLINGIKIYLQVAQVRDELFFVIFPWTSQSAA
jgi:hypothetical protein